MRLSRIEDEHRTMRNATIDVKGWRPGRSGV